MRDDASREVTDRAPGRRSTCWPDWPQVRGYFEASTAANRADLRAAIARATQTGHLGERLAQRQQKGDGAFRQRLPLVMRESEDGRRFCRGVLPVASRSA